MSNNLDGVMHQSNLMFFFRCFINAKVLCLRSRFRSTMKLNQWKLARYIIYRAIRSIHLIAIVGTKHNANSKRCRFRFIIHWKHFIWNYMQMNFLGNVPFLFISISEMQHGKWHFGSGLQKQITVKWLIYFTRIEQKNIHTQLRE